MIGEKEECEEGLSDLPVEDGLYSLQGLISVRNTQFDIVRNATGAEVQIYQNGVLVAFTTCNGTGLENYLINNIASDSNTRIVVVNGTDATIVLPSHSIEQNEFLNIEFQTESLDGFI
ncbi:hypothetical protein [Kordia sp.]|uniref:hypothetical protein n=1 Tax=Kordia sp. TaxID=1965332 RepID=UPI0025C3C8A1|nr:hypothetical protein [Kordia sp.]MCH2194390.1 hypothetical protein [Kordia sp.]